MKNFSKYFGFVSIFGLISVLSNALVHAKTYTTSVNTSNSDPVMSFVLLVLLLCCFGVIFLGIPLGCAIFIYRDAKKYNVENYGLWIFLSLLGIPLGGTLSIVSVLIYFLSIRKPYVKNNETI